MSTTLKPHAPSSKSAIVYDRKKKIIFAAGDTVPTDASRGYAKGCIFIQTDGAAGTHWYVNEGSTTSSDFNAALPTAGAMALLTSSISELNYLDQDLATNILSRGAGVDTAESYSGSISRAGGLATTRIVCDITGMINTATDLDIMGESAAADCHWGQITTAKSGTLIGGRVTCLEVPAGGSADLDFYSAVESTGAQDALVTSLTETALVTSGGSWTSGATKGMTGLPAAGDYIYITSGTTAGGTMTAGKFLIELFGTL